MARTHLLAATALALALAAAPAWSQPSDVVMTDARNDNTRAAGASTASSWPNPMDVFKAEVGTTLTQAQFDQLNDMYVKGVQDILQRRGQSSTLANPANRQALSAATANYDANGGATSARAMVDLAADGGKAMLRNFDLPANTDVGIMMDDLSHLLNQIIRARGEMPNANPEALRRLGDGVEKAANATDQALFQWRVRTERVLAKFDGMDEGQRQAATAEIEDLIVKGKLKRNPDNSIVVNKDYKPPEPYRPPPDPGWDDPEPSGPTTDKPAGTTHPRDPSLPPQGPDPTTDPATHVRNPPPDPTPPKPKPPAPPKPKPPSLKKPNPADDPNLQPVRIERVDPETGAVTPASSTVGKPELFIKRDKNGKILYITVNSLIGIVPDDQLAGILAAFDDEAELARRLNDALSGAGLDDQAWERWDDGWGRFDGFEDGSMYIVARLQPIYVNSVLAGYRGPSSAGAEGYDAAPWLSRFGDGNSSGGDTIGISSLCGY